MGYLGSNASFTGTQNNKRLTVIASQGQKLFTVPSGYAINAIDVYRNGVKLSAQRDFTALDGATVSLVTAANANDNLEFVSFENFARDDVLNADGDQNIRGSLVVGGDLSITGTLNATVSNTNTAGFATVSGISSAAQGDFSIPDKIIHTDDTNTAIRFPAADTFTVETAGSERLRIESDGNVRVSDEHLRFDTTGKGIIFGIDGGSDRPSIIGNYSSSSDNNVVFNTTGDERLRIESDGKIGINNNNPTFDLDLLRTSSGVGATMRVGATATSGINTASVIINSGGTGNASLDFKYESTATPRASIYVYRSNQELRFDTAGSERLRITSGGVVRVGEVTESSASTRLLVYEASGNGQTIEVKAANSSGAGSQPGIRFTASNDDNIGAVYGDVNSDSLQFSTGATERLRITSGGDLQVAAGGNLEMASNGRIFVGNGGNATNPMFANVSDTNTGIAFPAADNMMFATGGTERLRITSTGGFHFTNGELIERAKVTAGKLSDNTNIDLENGMVHLFTTQETTTSTPNIRINSSTSLNSVMAIGEMISVTLITTAAAGAYSAQLTIDGSAVTENWTGGSAPDAGGSSGVDIHAYTIIKTADATFTVVATQTTTS